MRAGIETLDLAFQNKTHQTHLSFDSSPRVQRSSQDSERQLFRALLLPAVWPQIFCLSFLHICCLSAPWSLYLQTLLPFIIRWTRGCQALWRRPFQFLTWCLVSAKNIKSVHCWYSGNVTGRFPPALNVQSTQETHTFPLNGILPKA